MKRKLSLLVAAGLFSATAAQADTTLLKLSYDPTRELYKDLGSAFTASYKADKVTVNTSMAVRAHRHAPSSKGFRPTS
jgi:sulfate transport system substrate-binding protein